MQRSIRSIAGAGATGRACGSGGARGSGAGERDPSLSYLPHKRRSEAPRGRARGSGSEALKREAGSSPPLAYLPYKRRSRERGYSGEGESGEARRGEARAGARGKLPAPQARGIQSSGAGIPRELRGKLGSSPRGRAIGERADPRRSAVKLSGSLPYTDQASNDPDKNKSKQKQDRSPYDRKHEGNSADI